MKDLLEIGHVNAVTSISFSSDARTLATGSYDGTAKVWDVATGQLLNTLIVPSEKCPSCREVNRICFTPDNQTLVCETFSGVLLWQRASSNCEPFPSEGCEQLVFSRRSIALSIHEGSALRLWDTNDWRRLRPLTLPCDSVDGAALSNAGQLAVVLGDKNLYLLDTSTGKIVWTISFSNGWCCASVTFSPDDQLVACANSSNRPRILDTKTGQTVAVLGAERHRQIGSGSWYHHLLAFSADGTRLATAGRDGMLKLWDVPSGRLRSVLSEPDVFSNHIDPETASHAPRPAAHKSWIRTIAFSPDGRLLASAGDDCIVKLWNPATDERVGGIGKLRNQVKSVALSPDDRCIVSGQEDGTLRLWNLGDGKLSRACSAHSEPVVSLALTSDGRTLVSGCSNGEVKTWNVSTLRMTETLREADGSVRSVACWGDSWVVAGGHRMDGRTQVGEVRLWNLETGSAGPAITEWGEVPTLTCGGWWAVEAVAISPDGRTLATSVGNEVRLWSMKTGQPIGTLVTGKNELFDRAISLTYSPDGRSLAGGTVTYGVALWNTATGERRTMRAKRDSIGDLAFTPDGKQIAVCTHHENIVGLHDLESGELAGTFEGHVNSVNALALSAKGDLLVSAGADGFVGVWDARQRRRVRFLRG